MSRTSTHRPQSINKPPLRELGRAPCFHWSESPVESEVGGLNLGDGKVFISFDAKRAKGCREEEGQKLDRFELIT